MTHDVHHLPGRLRIRIPGLKRNAVMAQSLRDTLCRIRGIQSVDANLLTGSLLVYYDPAVSNASAVLSAAGLDTAAEPSSLPPITRFEEKIAGAILWYAIEKAIPLVIAALLPRIV